ncbi:MAG: YicC/YloC family endoribonuclease [Mangrovibacterium sp.]
MIKSMTGYGKSELEKPNLKIIVEVKSLNSKSIDVSTRIAPAFRNKDIEIRKIIAEKAIRGKIDFSLHVESLGGESKAVINVEVVKAYLEQLQSLNRQMDSPECEAQLMGSILRLPDALKTEIDNTTEIEWESIEALIIEALTAFNDFRTQEGISLNNDLCGNIDRILQLLEEVKPFEEQRIINIKQRLNDGLKELEVIGKIDNNRLEQEMIFYIEKLDINEEKVRLAQHCKYFMETIESDADDVGKKLGFIAQEIGREINTLGSKSNESNMQRIVVQMKDALEKIKEQSLNVL